jgi:exportin-1
MQFKLLLDSIVWGFKHAMRDISDEALTIVIDLLTIFYVLTNSFHKSGFKLHVTILMQMFGMVESMPCVLYDGVSNVEFVRNFAVELLTNAFPHLQKYFL